MSRKEEKKSHHKGEARQGNSGSNEGEARQGSAILHSKEAAVLSTDLATCFNTIGAVHKYSTNLGDSCGGTVAAGQPLQT